MSDSLAIGLLQAPYGLKGDLRVRSYSGESDHFFRLEGESVRLRPSGSAGGAETERIIESVRVVEPHLLVRFKGFATPEAARALTGCEILVPRERASRLGEGEYYIADLIGSRVLFQGAEVGVVKSVWDSGAHELLELKVPDLAEPSGSRSVQVPFIARFIGAVDVEARTIELLVDWILE